jgi:hypothetical protein
MKKIAIISPDTIPLPFLENCPTSILDKCAKATALGYRVHHLAIELCKNFDVTILIPDLNYPLGHEDKLDINKIKYQIDVYDFNDCIFKSSPLLAEQLKKFDTVIIELASGAGFVDVAQLPKSIQVIIDGWVPLLVEYPSALSHYMDNEEKKKKWALFLDCYSKLLNRADLVLYANERQKHFYQGQSFILGLHNYRNLDNSKLLKVPYGVEKKEKILPKRNTKLKLLWYGAFYPWYNPELLISELYNHPNIDIHFFGTKHPRYKRYYESKFNTNYIESATNFSIIENYSLENPSSLFSEYDACILISKNWVEDTYSCRVRFFDILSYGMPLIINKGNPIVEELGNLQTIITSIETEHIKENLEVISNHKDLLSFSDGKLREFQEKFSWGKVISPLVTWIGRENADI